jgi:predicted nuclease of predicted toxin-antitoxin system
MDVRFLCDEHIDQAIAAALRNRGYDVLTLVDAVLLGSDDLKDILPFAVAEKRALVTRDADFLAFHAQGAAHAGIVHWHGKKRNVKEAIHYLLQLARHETSESMVGVVRFIKRQYP